MVRWVGLMVLSSVVAILPIQDGKRVRVEDGPKYASDGQLLFPKEYREWVFLASGLDMSYDPKPRTDGMHMFNNVFVNPAAYKVFQQTGHWPDGTELVLENRGAETGKSINVKGSTQSKELMGFEVHVLDSTHAEAQSGGKPDGWEFYGFQNAVSAKSIARPASCYSCHEAHAAVDTTFVQFYPTLMETAEKKQTLSSAYLKEISGR
jgi:hypothetical protein